ncbi:MAG TPA: zf-HC2 domain-containing protein [Terriglobales bacterium]|nr:zf-HC2 domain-containing protein [Terriglobales bacterium]
MRCERAERMISDALDGAIFGRRAARLARHLERCAACREYEREAGLIQAHAGGLADPGLTAGDWADFSRRLEAKVAAPSAPPPARARSGIPHLPSGKWAWATAASAALVVLAAYLAFLRPGAGREATPAPFEDSLAQVLGEADASPELASSLNSSVEASIEETVRPAAGEAPVTFGDNPLFWESLSEGELGELESALRKETKLGGVS